MKTYFTQKQYDSAEKPQDKFNSDASMIDFVAEEPGANRLYQHGIAIT